LRVQDSDQAAFFRLPSVQRDRLPRPNFSGVYCGASIVGTADRKLRQGIVGFAKTAD
jgi:hypothetical protein